MSVPAPTASRHLYARTRAAADRFIHHPATELGLVVLILLSVTALLAEAGFDRDHRARHILQVIGDIITSIFVLELSIRLWVAPRKARFLQRYWVDILAVLPLARPLRLLRVLLLLRLFRAGVLLNRRMSVFGGILRGTRSELMLMITVTLTVTLVAAISVHLGRGSVALDTPGLEGSLWFAVFTMIGGEPIGGTPTTELGRAVTLALMVGGLTIFGVFVGTVSASMVSLLSRRLEVNVMDLDELKDHIIVCGWNNAGVAMLRELFGPDSQASRGVVIVTESPELPADLPLADLRPELLYHYCGDYTQVAVLEAIGAARASMAILLSDTLTPRSDQDRDARTVLAALTIERLNPNIFCCAELSDDQHRPLLRMAGVEEVIVGDWYAGVILGSVGRNRGLVAVLDDILSTRSGNAFHKVTVPAALAGKTVGELHQLLLERHHAILVSLERTSHEKSGPITVNPAANSRVATGDVLVVIAPARVKL